MDQVVYDSITPRERSVLRLVAPRTKTSMIAGQLGLADGTVETHIKRARSKLGGLNRFDAADLLRAHECTQSLATQALEIGGRTSSDPPPLSVGQSFGCEGQEDELRERRATFWHASSDEGLRQPAARERHGLGTAGRIGLMIGMTVGFALTIVAVITMFGTIDRTLPGSLMTYRNS